jgi:imidazolonepropionase-like amidohydrolase
LRALSSGPVGDDHVHLLPVGKLHGVVYGALALPDEFFKAGVKFAFGSFNNEFVRDLPYQTATAVAFGLPYEEALKAITLNPAQIWGVADKLGSIEEGKSADLMVTDGDPLKAKTPVKQLFIKGKTRRPRQEAEAAVREVFESALNQAATCVSESRA